jgi:LCP family protein required for cell wall assembly
MNHQNRNSIDGFTLRRRNTTTGNSSQKLDADTLPVPQQFLAQPSERPPETTNQTHSIDQRPTSSTVGQAGMTAGTGRLADEINDSLRQIDEEKPQKPKRGFRFTKKGIKRALLILLAIAVLAGGYIGVKTLLAGSSVFNGNLFDVFTNKALKKDEFGRSNILMFGTSEDSPAHMESGAGGLTDSLMVTSIDQDKKNAIMFSVPRDLWVDYGQDCLAGYSGKINALYECAKDGTSEQEGANQLKSKIGETFGIDIQYYAKVNYTALQDAVNAVGGITVTIDSDDPRGIYDPNFDWQCGYKCKMVKWPNGPAELDGAHALALARARNAAGGYGLGGGNFDREQYQQKIILAIKDKAASAGTLANPVAVAGLIDSIGNNVETNFETSEIKTLVDLAGAINATNIRSINLVDEDKPLVTTGQYSGQSIVRPVAGVEDFSDIQAYIREQFTGSTSSSENATVEVLNGTDLGGVASKKEAELEADGVSVTSIGDAPTSSSYGAIQWFDMTGGSKPQMAKKIQEALGESSSGSTLPSGVQSDADFVIIVGNGAN